MVRELDFTWLPRSCLVRYIQLDFPLPSRLSASYGEDNEHKVPVMIHRAIRESMEVRRHPDRICDFFPI